MAKIFRSTDRKTIKIDDITIKVAPMTLAQKSRVNSLLHEGQKQNNLLIMNEGIYEALKFSLKDIQGLTDSNDEVYKLEFNEDGTISDICIEELTNMEVTAKLLQVCGQLISDFTKDSYDIEGVEVVKK